MKVKTYNKGFEAHKTERQWALKGYVPKADVKGVRFMASKKKKIRITICIAIILCFFIATIVFCILLKRAGTGITDFLKIGMGWSIVWAMIIHFSFQKLVFKKRQSKR